MVAKFSRKKLLDSMEFFTESARAYNVDPEHAVLNPKSQRLVFAGVLVKKLDLDKWDYVLLAKSRKDGDKTLYMKKATEPTEPGARRFAPSYKSGKAKAIDLKGFIRFFTVETAPKYVPELSTRDIMTLNPVESKKAKK